MSDLNDHYQVDGLDDVMAAVINDLIANSLQAKLANVETLSANKTLDDASYPVQALNPSGADRSARLPAEASTNHLFVFKNSGATYNLIVTDDSGTTTYATISPGTAQMIAPVNGTSWATVGGQTLVKASGAEIISGSDDEHYVTAKALADAGVLPGNNLLAQTHALIG